jgi:hypothetical protein
LAVDLSIFLGSIRSGEKKRVALASQAAIKALPVPSASQGLL